MPGFLSSIKVRQAPHRSAASRGPAAFMEAEGIALLLGLSRIGDSDHHCLGFNQQKWWKMCKTELNDYSRQAYTSNYSCIHYAWLHNWLRYLRTVVQTTNYDDPQWRYSGDITNTIMLRSWLGVLFSRRKKDKQHIYEEHINLAVSMFKQTDMLIFWYQVIVISV